MKDKFLSIDEVPIGSASISQVHRAVLKSGEEVAIKVKRKDITENLEKDIVHMKKLMHTYGRFFKFGNYSGGDKAFNLYFKWILEETDFFNEVQNIKKYTSFANSVNGKVIGNKDIKIPKLYEDLCTENIIVMEYIPYKTINKLDLNDENRERIKVALNSYISSSLYAMFNNLPIIFHGDPHGGNIYIDDNNNIGFLDMGLLFELDTVDAKMTKEFFFAAYTGDYQKMYSLVVEYGNMDKQQKAEFWDDIKDYCDGISKKAVTSYFIDMMNICLKYEFVPPNFLFCMAKAFVCLGGLNNISQNDISGSELLKEQVIKFFIKDSITKFRGLVCQNIDTIPKLMHDTFQYGLEDGIAMQTNNVERIYKNVDDIFNNSKFIFNLIKQN